MLDKKYNLSEMNDFLENKSPKEIIDYEKEHHRIGAVIQKSPGMGLSINKGKMKTDYRYFDPSITFNNWNIDNTRAKRIAPFRWTLSNTK